MTRAHFVKAAAKDYPQAGIKKGESYYWWKFKARYGNSPRKMSKTRPRPSQLTQSEYLSQALALQERVEDLAPDSTLPDELPGVIDDLRSLGDEQGDKLDNMPEGLQQGDTGQLLEQRRDACNEYANALESIDLQEFEADPDAEKDEPVNSDGETEDEYWQGKLDQIQFESFDIE